MNRTFPTAIASAAAGVALTLAFVAGANLGSDPAPDFVVPSSSSVAPSIEDDEPVAGPTVEPTSVKPEPKVSPAAEPRIAQPRRQAPAAPKAVEDDKSDAAEEAADRAEKSADDAQDAADKAQPEVAEAPAKPAPEPGPPPLANPPCESATHWTAPCRMPDGSNMTRDSDEFAEQFGPAPTARP